MSSAARSVSRSLAAPLGGIRQHEQVQTGEQEEDEREQRQQAYSVSTFLLCAGEEVGDAPDRKGNGQPAVGLPNHLFQFNGTSS
jgi:hypothetical protein